MEIKGSKIIKAFWLWFLLPHNLVRYKLESQLKYGSENAIKIKILSHAFSQRFGLFVDFFDDHGLVICIIPIMNQDGEQSFGYFINHNKTTENHGESGYSSRGEARLAAIEHATNIYLNNQNDV